MPASKRRRTLKNKEVINRNFISLVMLSVVAFIIGLAGGTTEAQKVSFIFLSLLLLLLGVVVQFAHSRKIRK